VPVRLVLCGVRGSTPAVGADFLRYGGHTSCVAVAGDDGSVRLVLDAGTGLRDLSRVTGGAAFQGTIVLGHLHWDHTHGLPFSAAVNRPDARVRVLIPEQGPAEDVLARAVSPPHFPVRPSQLTGEWSFGNIEVGHHEIEGFDVEAIDIPHPGGRMLAYRVSDGKSTLAYVSDHSPIDAGSGPAGWGEYHDAICDVAHGADVLIHDAQYTNEEFPARRTYGHSTFDYAIELARMCEVPRLILFHHDPARTDEQLDRIMEGVREQVGEGFSVDAARQGSEVTL